MASDAPITDANLLRQAVLTSLVGRITCKGEVSLPCIPTALEAYVLYCADLFRTLGKPLIPQEVDQVRRLLADTLEKGFQASADARLVVQYEVTGSPNLEKDLDCSVGYVVPSLAEQYGQWTQTQTTPLFGSHPDAKVLAIVREFPQPAQTPILDIGAGTGRNALPLARLGYPVDALELTPEFVQQLQTAAQQEKLPLTAIMADILDPHLLLPSPPYAIVLASEVISHWRETAQLRLFFERTSQVLRSGGILLCNLFLTEADYEPEPLVRQMAAAAWSCLFTRSQLNEALAGLPLELVSQESAVTYEQTHLPPEAWPPTPWFDAWARGKSVFPLQQGQPPIGLYWLLCRRL